MNPSNPYKPALAALVLTLAALLLATCPNPSISDGNPGGESGPGGADAPAGMGLAVIQLEGVGDGSAARTAVPDHINGYLFILSFTADGKTDVELELSSSGDTSVTVPLEIGAWKLEIRAYTTGPGQNLTLMKTKSDIPITIKAETTEVFKVSMELSPDFSGMGYLEYSIGIPASTQAWLGLYPLDVSGILTDVFGNPSSSVTDDDSFERDLSLSAGGKATGVANKIPGGAYRAVIDLYNAGANKFAVYSTIVHIYDKQTTSLDRTFTVEGNFADCPPEIGKNETTLAAKLDAALASSEPDCTIVLDGNETDVVGNNPGTFAPKTLSLGSGGSKKTITIRGNGNTVKLDSAGGSLFTLSAVSDSSLTLELRDVTLQGLGTTTDNTAPLVQVESGATLELRTGSSITGNIGKTTPSFDGGGVSVNGGTFVMNGGAVSGNTTNSFDGGGVSVNGGTFEMNGGAVGYNIARDGGGVSVKSGGTFTMNGGTVGGNITSFDGGGVSVKSSGTFTMNGGKVNGNRASSSNGGGVYVEQSGTFTMSGGAVSGNTAFQSGGGVYVRGGGTFTMSDGTVSGNTVDTTDNFRGGGGVYAIGTVTMSGGTISGNTASGHGAYGGGVYVTSGTFTMSGGEVGGNTAATGKEVQVKTGTFIMSADARPERILLNTPGTSAISIGGNLNGGMTTMIDLKITSGTAPTEWENKSVLKLDSTYPTGILATLKARFDLGNAEWTSSPYTAAIPTGSGGYTIDDDGKMVVSP